MKSSKDFIGLLRLNGEVFEPSTSLDGIVANVFDFANKIWTAPRLFNFVDHGIDHGYRVLQIALNIIERLTPPETKLSPLERLILGIGGLIHDIGMQYNKYPDPEQDPKTDTEIRRNHCELGMQMIKDSRDGVFESQRAGPTLAIGQHLRSWIHFAALVGFAHSGRKCWDALKEPMYSSTREGGDQIRRLRLLAALIRLADELHCEYTRIPELNWVNSAVLSGLEQAHWVACYYTQEIRITSPGYGGLRLHMKWRAPEQATEDEVNIVRTLLQDLRERKINEEIELIKEYLKVEDESDPFFLEFKMDADPEKSDIYPLPDRVKDYVTKELRPYQFGVKKVTYMSRLRQIPSSPEVDELKYEAETFFLQGKGVIHGHFRLKTGWHTNKYVRCRELCSNSDFLSKLAKELFTVYKDLNISDVIAVGTSAIGIGSLVALLLNARLSYTFGHMGIVDSTIDRRDYTDYEKEIGPFDGGNILIIDDILGVGSILHELVGRLRNIPSPPGRIRIFTLYSLGDVKPLLANIKGIDIDFLAAFPDVDYDEEDNVTHKCRVCQKHPGITRVEV
jgi:orotate phosphoribosyltransferase